MVSSRSATGPEPPSSKIALTMDFGRAVASATKAADRVERSIDALRSTVAASLDLSKKRLKSLHSLKGFHGLN